MAAAVPGTMTNAEWGYVPADSSIILLAALSVGFISGDVELRTPREYARLELDQVIVSLAAVQTRKAMNLTFTMEELLQANLQYAMDNDAWSTNIMSVDDDTGTTVALALTMNAPTGGTRTVAIPKALGIGDAAIAMRASASQQLAAEFEAIGDPATNGLLGTYTDAYA